MAIKLNRLDEAKAAMKDYLLNYKREMSSTKSKNELIDKKNKMLHNLLEVALLENKCEFVSLLLEHDINLTEFLKNERMNMLYNNEVVCIALLYYLLKFKK